MPSCLRFSVIIPCHNAAAFLQRTLVGVQEQRTPPHEVILVDDGSTDDSESVAKSCFPGIRVIRQDNRGAAAARNAGWRVATGTHIAFLDADDYWLPHHLEQAAACLERHPGLKWYAAAWRVNDSIRGCTYDQVYNGPLDPGDVIPNYFRVVLKSPYPLVCSNSIVVAQELISTIGGFEEAWLRGEDIEFWCRIAARYPQLAYGRGISSVYQKQEGSITELPKKKNLDESLNVLLRIGKHVCSCEALTDKERRTWYTPWVRIGLRKLAISPDQAAASRFMAETKELLTPTQRLATNAIRRLPRVMQAWYKRPSYIRPILGI